jgi:anti-sigma factor RsiW
MNCRRYIEGLTAYLDGELTLRDRDEMEIHLRDCRKCAEELAGLKRVGAFINRHASNLEPNPEMWNNLRIRIAALPEAPSPRGLFERWFSRGYAAAWAGIAAAAVLAVGFWGYSGYRDSRESLDNYMQQYVQERQFQEALVWANTGIPPTAVMDGGFPGARLENPFVVAQPKTFDNPFRSEVQ